MTIEKLFFQLIQVSIGQLDCLDRGPSPEEWHELYRLSKKHGLVTTCYDGVVRLFDFGLRAPQDLSIDWMAETEVEQEQQVVGSPTVVNPLRKMLFQRWMSRNGSSLFQRGVQPPRYTPQTSLVIGMLKSFEEFHEGTMTLHVLVDGWRKLHLLEGTLPTFRDGSSVEQMLKTLGIWRFSRAMMWAIGEVTALDKKKMPFAPDATGGKFLLSELMTEKMSFKTRMINRLKRRIMF